MSKEELEIKYIEIKDMTFAYTSEEEEVGIYSAAGFQMMPYKSLPDDIKKQIMEKIQDVRL